MKLPRLPNKCSILEAKYSKQQMHEYGQRCIDEHMKQIKAASVFPDYIPKPPEKSILDKIMESLK